MTAPVIIFFHIIAEMLRTGIVPSPSKTRMKRVTATDGTGDGLRGICIFFLRPNTNKPVTVASVSEELVCGQLDTSDGRSILEVLQEYLSEVMVPALTQGQNWGTLQPLQVENFMNTLKNYINFIKGMYCVRRLLDINCICRLFQLPSKVSMRQFTWVWRPVWT